MSYIESSPDRKQHKVYHDRIVNGIPARHLKNDCQIWEKLEGRITVVTSRSPISQRKRAQAVASIANLETHYNGGIYNAHEEPDDRDIHLFLYYKRKRIIGLIVLEKRQTVWRCRWQDDALPVCEQLVEHDPMWSIIVIWVQIKHRRRGIGRTLFDEALKYLGLSHQDVDLPPKKWTL